MARPYPRRALPLALVPFAALPTLAAAAPAQPHTVLRSGYGVDAPLAVTAGGRAVAVWSGGLRGGSVSAAEHTPGTAAWPAPTTVANGMGGGVAALRVAANAAGVTAAVWLTRVDGAGASTLTIEGARRTGTGAWTALPRLATVTDANMVPLYLPVTPLDVAVTPDGGAMVVYATTDGAITAVHLAPGGGAWDTPVTVRPPVPARPSPSTADVTVAAGPGGRVTALWTEQAADRSLSVQTAEWTGGAWSAPAALPGAEGGYYPDVAVTPAGETIAAWTTPAGNQVATRPAGGAWSAATRVGDGYGPDIAVGAHRVAVTWGTAGRGGAVRDAPGGAWTPTTAPVAPVAAAFTRDDRLLVAGTLTSRVLVWARRSAGGAWERARVASRQQDLIGVTGAVIVPAPRGPLASLIWAGNVREGRLGMPRGGTVVQGLDLAPTIGDAVGSTSRVVLPGRAVTVNAYAVTSVWPTFPRYAGPTPVRIQTRRAGRWHASGAAIADVDTSVMFRVGGPGRLQMRLAYGPGFRRTTNAVAVTVKATAQRRVIAGWRPTAVAGAGRDLWVLSADRSGVRTELRLLDGTTGVLRRGPIRLPRYPTGVSLVETGGPVLLTAGSTGFTLLDPARPGLLGPEVTLAPGACTAAACTPLTLATSGATPVSASRSVGGNVAPIAGPDGRVWSLGPGVADEGGGVTVTLRESVAGGAPVTREASGFVSYHGGLQAEMIAVDGGVWFRGALGDLLWLGTTGAGVAKGDVEAVRGGGRCVWGLAGASTTARVVRLREGGTPNAAPIPVPGVPATEAPFAVGPRSAWIIADSEQTLVRAPIPAC